MSDKQLLQQASHALQAWARGQSTSVDCPLIDSLNEAAAKPPGLETERLQELSARSSSRGIGLLARAGKLSEEQGELWQEILAYEGISNASASAAGNVEDVAEETVDVLINCLDILYSLGVTNKQINLIMAKKCDKWERKPKRA